MPLLDLFWSMLMFSLYFMWIWMVVGIVIDIFRSDMRGLVKALWVVFVIVLPFLGVLIYLIANGADMRERAMARAVAQDSAQRAYIREAAGGSTADELEKLRRLRDDGVLSDEEFASQKAKLLA